MDRMAARVDVRSLRGRNGSRGASTTLETTARRREKTLLRMRRRNARCARDLEHPPRNVARSQPRARARTGTTVANGGALLTRLRGTPK
jgi:hypothetical protein